MGEHNSPNRRPKEERDGSWRRGERPRDVKRRAEAFIALGQRGRGGLLKPLPEPEGL